MSDFFGGAFFGTGFFTPHQSGGGGHPNKKKYGKKPKYWWEIDPSVIPEDIPLAVEIAEIEQEELALQSVITDLIRERVISESVRMLQAYAEILKEAREVKTQTQVLQRESTASKRTLARKRLLLLN